MLVSSKLWIKSEIIALIKRVLADFIKTAVANTDFIPFVFENQTIAAGMIKNILFLLKRVISKAINRNRIPIGTL